MPMEGSVQLEMKRKRGRPAAQTPPRTHLGALSQAATELSTSSSDPEPLEPLPLRQQEDLEPSTAEHRAMTKYVSFINETGCLPILAGKSSVYRNSQSEGNNSYESYHVSERFRWQSRWIWNSPPGHKHVSIHIHMELSQKTNWKLEENILYQQRCKKDPHAVRNIFISSALKYFSACITGVYNFHSLYKKTNTYPLPLLYREPAGIIPVSRQQKVETDTVAPVTVSFGRI
ncbi:hypothetical protein E5288_WYG009470 [Bos mutus]|uniref:Uncharacterized protein n=1 Tax=Bos mutus TaxID=72004 RepID=A0A6B0SAD9_9CETA|nr:hypothetical protein [Bos mutus]